MPGQVTAAGERFIDEARRLLDAADDLERSLKRYPCGEAGRFAFGLGPLLASMFLPQLSVSLLRDFPGLRIQALVRPPSQLVTELLTDRIEMILGNNWNLGRMPGTDLEQLGKLRIGVMVRQNHPLARAASVMSADLERYPVASAIDTMVSSTSDDTGGVVCDNFHILREAVLESDCTWMSSPAFLAEDIQVGRIVQLNVTDLASSDTEICFVSKRGRTRSVAMVRVREQVRGLLTELSQA